MTVASQPLVVHLIYRLDFGGLETLLVDCINHMPTDQYRHAVICLTDYTDFSQKITRDNVQLFALHKPAGLGLQTHWALWKLLRQLRPTILHTYNLSAVEYAFTAFFAGVPIRVHAEHGRDISDPQGLNQKHNMLRRWMLPFIDRFVPVSQDLQKWLRERIGVPEEKNVLINNGVNVDHYHPEGKVASIWSDDCFVIGTVGRAQSIKNHAGLIRAFIALRNALPDHQDKLRLSIIGDGPTLASLRDQVEAAGLQKVVWLPGARSDIADIMRGFDVFTLPSIAEGTPVTLLEAMASGLPIVASRVGGIPEVVQEGEHGKLIAAQDDEGFAQAFSAYFRHPEIQAQHGAAGRALVCEKYSVAAMVNSYAQLYRSLQQNKLKA